MSKDDMDLLKGFPLSIEQKERLLNLIKSNSSSSNNINSNAYFEIYRANSQGEVYVSMPTKTVFNQLIINEANTIKILIEDIDFYNYIIDKNEATIKTDILNNNILISKNHYIIIDNDQYYIYFNFPMEIKIELIIRRK